MKTKYSRRLVYAVIEFLKAANEELGEDITEDKVFAMIDAFDPSLRRQMLMQVIAGEIGDMETLKVIQISNNPQKINAIKEIRSATGLGLKEAKDVCEGHEISTRNFYNWNTGKHRDLHNAIRVYGYELT